MSPPNVVPESLARRLEQETARLIGRPVGSQDSFGLAVSGGADSMAMLALAARCWPGQVEAATVDHGLRPDSKNEAAMVARWCADNRIPHCLLHVDGPITGNIQAEARSARYALLETWLSEQRLAWLLTAHQADDQIETLLLRLNRGAGVSGLASVRSRRGSVLRPMLGVRRAELRAFCEQEGIPFADDPSNEDLRFDRVRLRQALSGSELIDPAGLSRSVEALAEAEGALAWATDRLAAECLDLTEGQAILNDSRMPPELLRRLLLRMIGHLNPLAEKPRGPSLDQALVQLFDGKSVTLADCLVTGGGRWIARRAPPRRTV